MKNTDSWEAVNKNKQIGSCNYSSDREQTEAEDGELSELKQN